MRPLMLCALSALTLAAAEPPTFVEREGIVSIEAEHFTDRAGPWFEVEGRNATERQSGTSPDYRLTIAARSHPLAAGLKGEIAMPRNTWVQWGFPGTNAQVAVTLGHDARKAAVFGYDKGTVLADGRKSPSRRAFAPMPHENAPELARLLQSACAWAADGLASKKLVLLTNARVLSRSEEEVRKALTGSGLSLSTIPADGFKAESDALYVIPVSVRAEKLEGRLHDIEARIVLAGKNDVAAELGMTPPPVTSPDGANAMMIDTGRWTDHLRYSIHFTQPGEYNVWLLGQSGGTAGSDEAKIFFDVQPSSKADSFFEMRFDDVLDWTGRATARRPDNRKTPVPARIRVPAPGWHNLYVVRGAEPDHHTPEPPREFRYPNWRIDKIVLMRSAVLRPHSGGPKETLNDGSVRPPAELLTSSEWRPAQVWRVRDGVAVIEAEAIEHHPDWWTERTEPSGFTGKSYLEWRGPNWSRSIEGLGGNNDLLHVRQGPPEGWLILRFEVEEPGAYRLDVRNRHEREDGDNDCWVARLGQRATRSKPIVRLGDSHKDGAGFTWLDWGIHRFEFQKGRNEVYIGGRSVGFGVDRIALYRDGDDDAKKRALALDAKLAEGVK